MPGLRFIVYVVVGCAAVFSLFTFLWFFFSRGGFGVLMCPRCASGKIRASEMPGFMNRQLGLLAIQAFRCGGCGLRFHAFRWYRRAYSRD